MATAIFKPLSQLNSFFKLARERTLCGIDQLVYLHIFNKFNQSHWAETILLADAELLECISWYDKTGSPASLASIRNAKARLKKKSFIDFKPGKGNKPTEYKLIKFYPSDTPTDTPSDTPSDTGLVSYTVRAEDVMKEEGRVKDDAGARASTQVVAREDKRDEVLDGIIAEWERAGGTTVSMLIVAQLNGLLATHAPGTIKLAIKEAGLAKNSLHWGFSFAYFMKKLKEVEDEEKDTGNPEKQGNAKKCKDYNNWFKEIDNSM